MPDVGFRAYNLSCPRREKSPGATNLANMEVVAWLEHLDINADVGLGLPIIIVVDLRLWDVVTVSSGIAG